MLIYKILRPEEWQALCAHGETAGAPIDVQDGYVHFSTADQTQETAARHFAGAGDLVLAAFDTDSLGPALKWEVSRGGALFPHLYAPLRLSQVVWHAALRQGADGHIFPAEMAQPAAPDAHVDPMRAQFDAFKLHDRDAPIEMLNLVRLRGQAAYPASHPLAGAGLTGAAAYGRYGAETATLFEDLGGRILWRGRFRTTLIGPVGDHWDHAFIARYPSAHAFLAMITDTTYQKAVIHRQAAVATSRLYHCAEDTAGAGFA